MRFKNVIIGGGFTGLYLANRMEQEGGLDDDSYIIIDAGHKPGGLLRTDRYRGFKFDRGVRVIHAEEGKVNLPHQLQGLFNHQIAYQKLVPRRANIGCYVDGDWLDYPYQLNQHQLPLHKRLVNAVAFLGAQIPVIEVRDGNNLYDYIIHTFGMGIANNFLLPFNHRKWAYDLDQISVDCVGGRILQLSLSEMMNMLAENPVLSDAGSWNYWYPKDGGIDTIVPWLTDLIPDNRMFRQALVVQVDVKGHEVHLSDGEVIKYDRLYSTMPLTELLDALWNTHEEDHSVLRPPHSMRATDLHLVNIGLKSDDVRNVPKDYQWVDVCQQGIIFHRLNFPHRINQYMTPTGLSSIQAEVTSSKAYPSDVGNLTTNVIHGLCQMGVLTTPIVGGDEILFTQLSDVPNAYLSYGDGTDPSVICRALQSRGIYPCGRSGTWRYIGMDQIVSSMLERLHG